MIFTSSKEILVKWGSCPTMTTGKSLGSDRVNFPPNTNFTGIFLYRVRHNLASDADFAMKRKTISTDTVIYGNIKENFSLFVP